MLIIKKLLSTGRSGQSFTLKMRDEKTKNSVMRNDSSITRNCNPLTISQLTEYYKKKKRLNDESCDNSCKKEFSRREMKRPYLLKLPKIAVQQQALPCKESDTDKHQKNKSGSCRLPVINPEHHKTSTPSTRMNNQIIEDFSHPRIGVDKDIHRSKEFSLAISENQSNRNEEGNYSKGSEDKSDQMIEVETKTEVLDHDKLKVPVTDEESTTQNGCPKRITRNEYTKRMMLRKKKSWKERRKEAKLFDIDLLNSQRAMLTSSATARGLKVLKANEVIIYRFCLSNYSDVDIQTVAE